MVSRRRPIALLAAALLVLVAAGCGSGSGGGSTGGPTRGAARESAGHFVERILREDLAGQYAAQWTELHPGQQKLITRDQYVLCSERMTTNVGTGREKYRINSVRTAPFHERGVPERTSRLVSITVRGPAIASTFHFHAILHAGRWAWVLGPAFLQKIAQGECLDGSPLAGSPRSASGATGVAAS